MKPHCSEFERSTLRDEKTKLDDVRLPTSGPRRMSPLRRLLVAAAPAGFHSKPEANHDQELQELRHKKRERNRLTGESISGFGPAPDDEE